MLTVDYDRLGLKAGHHLLDLGCGFGRHAFEAIRRGAHVTACDMAIPELVDTKNTFAAMAEAGELTGVDSTSLASLVAGCIAATGGLAKIVGEEEFPVHFHQGERDNLHITLVGTRIILVVIFDDRSSLGLVRLRVKKAGAELARILEELEKILDTPRRNRVSAQVKAMDEEKLWSHRDTSPKAKSQSRVVVVDCQCTPCIVFQPSRMAGFLLPGSDRLALVAVHTNRPHGVPGWLPECPRQV